MSVIELKEIIKLKGMKFVIPSFQRGYRWKEANVTQLLNDIYEFKSDNKDKDSYYCIQPLVVMQEGNQYLVIDGQQRLTTIDIILHELMKSIEDGDEHLFVLEYETRRNIEHKYSEMHKINNQTVDEYFMGKAYKCVKEWFEEKIDIKDEMLDTIKNRVKFIFYELDVNQEDAYDVFIRLNSGKIPLTNSELIKAVFLKRYDDKEGDESFRLRQLRIATEWDNIERKLSEPSFGKFINKDYDDFSTHIDFLFNIYNKKHSEDTTKGYNKHSRDSFNYIYNEVKKTEDRQTEVNRIWKEIKELWLIIEAWYVNRELYHVIGYILLMNKYDIIEIFKEQKTLRKSEFIDKQKTKIREKINCDDILKLSYDKDKDKDKDKNKDKNKIKQVLLLFNIATIQNTEKSNDRFPFHLFKDAKWDIEHIHSQTYVEVDDFSESDRKQWIKILKECYNYQPNKNIELSDDDPTKKILDALNDFDTGKKPLNNDSLKSLFGDVKRSLQINDNDDWEDGIDTLKNLTLLNRDINRSYGNAWFPFKREKILKEEQNGVFIPICTRNIFLKAYTQNFTNVMQWSEDDGDRYIETIKSQIGKYLKIEDSNEQ